MIEHVDTDVKEKVKRITQRTFKIIVKTKDACSPLLAITFSFLYTHMFVFSCHHLF